MGIRTDAARKQLVPVLLPALLLTAINAAKPLVIDDAAGFYYAQQIASHPLDPYGFEVSWGDAPVEANRLLMPPVLQYWWGAAIALFGLKPVLWKLWLLPFALLLCGSLHFLATRFARPWSTQLTWLLALSPAVATGFNLMLDVPALALGLTCLAITVRACGDRVPSLERPRFGSRPALERLATSAILAGAVAALALQTKYASATLVCVSFGFALYRGAVLWAGRMALTTAVACAVWEGFIAWRYGESHLWLALQGNAFADTEKSPFLWAVGLASLIGALAPCLGLLALARLRAPAWIFWLGCGAVAAVFAAIPFWPADGLATLGHSVPNLKQSRPELWPFVGAGLFTLALWIAAGRNAHVEFRTQSTSKSRSESLDPSGRFLAGWIVIEVGAFFLLNPFMAARRILGLTIAAGLWLCHGLESDPQSTRRMKGILAIGLAVTAIFSVADLSDALARRDVVSLVDQRTRPKPQDARVTKGEATRWYAGHWGFQFYAERAGMQPVLVGESRLRAGDWLILSRGSHTQRFRIKRNAVRHIDAVSTRSPWPWTTQPGFYSGPIPLRRQPLEQTRVDIYRVLEDFTPTPL